LKKTTHGSSTRLASIKIFTAAIASWSASFDELLDESNSVEDLLGSLD
jgi:hypothetical protein